ncbi:MAG TPA: hypothetical protein VKT53_00695 [Candidatus Acidoferrum sp.]|nr:hypothetical protein [Candidatus Acidoferrum sp.]
MMLSANECGAWLTLAELSAMTRYPAASISAQLRHLKKPQFGNYELEKQLRAGADLSDGHGAVWEYRLTRRTRVVRVRTRSRSRGGGFGERGCIAHGKRSVPDGPIVFSGRDLLIDRGFSHARVSREQTEVHSTRILK